MVPPVTIFSETRIGFYIRNEANMLLTLVVKVLQNV